MTRLSARLLFPAAALLLAFPTFAAAQQPAPDAAVPEIPSPAQPNGSAGTDPCAGQPGANAGGQTLTGQLAQCGGVLTPPATGDAAGAAVPDPTPNTTPVVPPQAVPDQAPNGRPAPSANGGSSTNGG